MLVLPLVVAVGYAGAAAGRPTSDAGAIRSAAPPAFGKIVVIVFENKSPRMILGNPAAPTFNALERRYATLTNYDGVAHPSLPNYLALTAGSTFGITSDCTTCFVNSTNLADQIESSGRSWKAYMESMPSPCFVGDSGQYAQKHDPWIYYNDIRTNIARCAAHVVPFTQFGTDMASGSVPNFVWITPNMCNDMHDCSVGTGDTWLSQQVPTILNSSAYKNNGALFIVWDEGTTNAGCCTDAAGGRVAMLVISPLGKPGLKSSVPEPHYSLLRTIEDSWGLARLNGAGCSCSAEMREYFR